MDEKAMALIGAAAGVTLMGRGLRPVGKLMMHGVVAVAETAAASKRGVEGLYNEVRAEREKGQTQAGPYERAGTPADPSQAPPVTSDAPAASAAAASPATG